MRLDDAIKCFKNKFPDRKVVGYWERENDFVFNTKPPKGFRNLIAPAQFVVTSNGEVYGTNLFRENLDIKDMKKI